MKITINFDKIYDNSYTGKKGVALSATRGFFAKFKISNKTFAIVKYSERNTIKESDCADTIKLFELVKSPTFIESEKVCNKKSEPSPVVQPKTAVPLGAKQENNKSFCATTETFEEAVNELSYTDFVNMLDYVEEHNKVKAISVITIEEPFNSALEILLKAAIVQDAKISDKKLELYIYQILNKTGTLTVTSSGKVQFKSDVVTAKGCRIVDPTEANKFSVTQCEDTKLEGSFETKTKELIFNDKCKIIFEYNEKAKK